MASFSRRRFLQFVGAAGTWTLVGCGKYPGPMQVAPVPPGWDRGEERWLASTCLQCPGRCGIMVRVYEGRAIKIEGNPDHPLNRGGLCPKGQAGLQALYDPDRIPCPMRKVGGRSSTQWEAITWEEALDTVARRLRALRDAGRPESLLLLGGRFPGRMRALLERFAAAYGTPNLLDAESISNRTRRLAIFLTQGIAETPALDLASTRYFLVFGAGLLESWLPTGYLLRMYGVMREGQPGLRAKIAVVDPRCGVGAAKAVEWVPIRPGTDAALALGMAHVIVREGLHDRAFLSKHAFGFDEWIDDTGSRHEGFAAMVLREYPPDSVAKITGVPAGSVERLAREFAAARPSVAAAGRGISVQTNGLFANMAIHALNALVGSLDVPGGLLVQEPAPLASWPDAAADEVARAGASRPPLAGTAPGVQGFPGHGGTHGALVESLTSGKPYAAEACLVYYTNPLFSGPDTEAWTGALDRVPFLVSFSPFMDDTTARADLVLPDGTYLERLEDDQPLPSVGHAVLCARQPVMRPLGDTRHSGDVFIELARRIGGSVGAAFPWKSYEAALVQAIAGVAASGTGSFTAAKPEKFWNKLRKTGVWVGPPYRFGETSRVFRTPSGKFEFYPLAWKRHVEAEARRRGERQEQVLDRLGIQARGDLAFLPHHEPPRLDGDPRRFPLHLHTYKTMTHAEGRGGNQPWLQESFGVQLQERWGPWAEINPDTALLLGIRDHDLVWIESERGRVRMRARIYTSVLPEVVNVPFEYGHADYGRWARAVEGNPNRIVTRLQDRASGVHAVNATRVRVYKA